MEKGQFIGGYDHAKEGEQQRIKSLINASFPDLTIESVKRLGSGTDSIAYEVNGHLIFRFPQLHRGFESPLTHERKVLGFLHGKLDVQTPEVKYADDAVPLVGHEKIQGAILNEVAAKLSPEQRQAIPKQIAAFLSDLHRLSVEDALQSGIKNRLMTKQTVLARYRSFYDKSKSLIPAELQPKIEAFLADPSEFEDVKPVLCHRDLFSGHLMIDDQAKVIGVIDWGNAGVDDPAIDLARQYKAFGTEIAEQIMDAYIPPPGESKERISERARFYHTGRLFERLWRAHTKEAPEEKVEKRLADLQEIFG